MGIKNLISWKHGGIKNQMEAEPKLLNCLCGLKALLVELPENKYTVKCSTKKCFPSGAHWRLSKEEAIKMWNKRINTNEQISF